MKILIVGAMRTGGHYLGKRLSKKHNLFYLGEILNTFTHNKYLKNGYFDDVETKIWLDICFNKFNTKICLEDTYLEKLNHYIFSELVAEFYLKVLERQENYVIKIIADSLHMDESASITFLCKYAKIVDKIYYTQRLNLMDQVVSLSVARKSGDWMENRDTFDKELSDDELTDAYQLLIKQYRILNNLYSQYPGEVVTLEKQLEQKPYPNKFIYKGDWVLPKKFPLINEQTY